MVMVMAWNYWLSTYVRPCSEEKPMISNSGLLPSLADLRCTCVSVKDRKIARFAIVSI